MAARHVWGRHWPSWRLQQQIRAFASHAPGHVSGHVSGHASGQAPGPAAASPVGLAALLDVVSRAPPPTAAAPAVHIVQSTGRNPFANLAVEHRLFEHAHPACHLLLLYRNAPCVVVGRNQNPWAEVALPAVAAGAWPAGGGGARPPPRPVLVRRRSGGGAVYHDAGNANWSVHSPAGGSFDFDRDRHAAMVVRALQRLGVARARVNARHDIVVGGGDTDAGDAEFKVSGSAYKLTTRRALHHGTCLLGTDLAAVAGLLRAPPAAPFVKARGVASVRSPVQNVALAASAGAGVDPDPHARFAAAVAAEFQALYGPATTSSIVDVDAEAATAVATDGAFAADARLARGYAELQSLDWLFAQTPQFSFSTRPTADDPRPRPPRPARVPPAFHLAFTARHGRLQDVAVDGLGDDADAAVAAALEGQLLHEIRDWQATLQAAAGTTVDAAIGAWLDGLLGVSVS